MQFDTKLYFCVAKYCISPSCLGSHFIPDLGYGNYPDEMSVSMPQTFVKYTFQFLLHFVVYGVLARGIETT